MSERISWTWRHAIAQSDLQATTKHVLLTISLYMNEMGKGCYPTQEDLAKATSLTERAVRKHIDLAEKEGWITRREHGFRGQKWRNHEYEPRWPDRQDVDSENLHIDEAAEPRSGPSSKAAEPRSGKVRNHVPPNVPEPSNTSLRSERERVVFDDLWEVFPQSPYSKKLEALSDFNALSETDQHAAFSGAQHFAAWFREEAGRRKEPLADRLSYAPSLARWLRNRGWIEAMSLKVKARPNSDAAKSLENIEYVDRVSQPALFEACERIRGRAAPVSIQRFAFDRAVVEQARIEASEAA